MERKNTDNNRLVFKRRKNVKTWKSIVSILACIVVFCTTYALILPAITMEAKTFCGKEEHSHSDECYETELHCNLSEEKGSVHTHTEECYESETVLQCELKESAGHTHTEECKKIEKQCVCDKKESAGHTHTDVCYAEDGSLICGQEENAGHTHTDACYTEKVSYICGQEESAGHTHTDTCYKNTEVLVCEQETGAEKHIHTEECYKKNFVCEKEEHSHTKICYADKNADVETAEVWEKTLPDELTGVWADDVLAVADSQLEYTESTKNYVVDDDGEVRGYSRYGDWYGDSYGHWCAMFVSFCLNYADVDEALMPYDSNCQNWIETLSDEDYELYHEAGDYEPVPGDLIFFNWDKYDDSDHVGLVYEIIEATDDHGVQIKTIEGNASDTVKYRTYDIDDNSIMGYGQLPEKPEKTEETEESEELQEETAKTETVPKMFSRARAGTLSGIWHEDILTVARNASGVSAASFTSWFSEKYPDKTNNNASTAFVSYCIVNAGISVEDLPIAGSISEFISLYSAKGLYNEKTKLPKAGDLVFIASNWNETNTIGVISEVVYNPNEAWNSYINVVFANGTVQEGSYNQFMTQGNIRGFVEIPVGELTATDGSTFEAKAEFSLNDNKVLIGSTMIVNKLEATDARNELVKSELCPNGNNVKSNYYYEVYFEKDGRRIEPTGNVNITLTFDEVLDPNKATEEASGDVVWIYGNIPAGDATISDLNPENAEITSNDELQSITFQYSDGSTYVFSATQESKVKLSTTDKNITVTAAGKATVLNEDMKILITELNTSEYAETWSEKLKETYETEKKVVSKNEFINIQILNADGSVADIPEDAEIEIEVTFDPALSPDFDNGTNAISTEWKLNYLTNAQTEDVSVEDSTETDKVKVNDKAELTGASLLFDEKEVYAFTAVAANPEYLEEVYNYEQLKNALSVEDSFVRIKLGEDIEVPEGSEILSISGGREIYLDLNGYDITTDSSLFKVTDNSKLTLIDGARIMEETSSVAEVNIKADDDGESATELATNKANVGMLATYNELKQSLTYYVTESIVTDTNVGATKETLVKHVVPLKGVITGGDAPVIVVENGTFNMESGAITGCTNSAISQSGGTLNLKGGYICNNHRSSGSGGAVNATNGAAIVVDGAVIVGNSAPVDGGAIYINGSSFELKSGVIGGNEAGSSGGGGFADGYTYIEISGGYLTNNVARDEAYRGGGGGMYTGGDTNMQISGGYVTGNYAESGGGGIRTFADRFRMTGGFVNSNYANLSEGGGLSINEYGIGNILGGYINNNVSNTHQHWGGGGIFSANDSSLYIRNIIVTQNDAGGYGGGVAGCSTGRAFIYGEDGGAIYGNTAVDRDSSTPHISGGESTKAEDHIYPNSVFRERGYEDYFCAFNSVISGTMLGGGAANWTGSIDSIPVVVAKDEVVSSAYLMGLVSEPSSTSITAAQQKAKVYVNGNDSYTHGGGILGNGYLVVGGVENVEVFSRLKVEATKDLQGGTLEAGQFEFIIENMDTGFTVATGTNDEKGNIVFAHMIPFDEVGTYEFLIYEEQTSDEEGKYDGILMDTTQYKLTVVVDKIEESLEVDADFVSDQDQKLIKKYRYIITSIQVDKKNEGDWETVTVVENPDNPDNKPVTISLSADATFTNVITDKVKASVLKKWSGNITPTEIEVQLLQDGQPYGDPVKLNKDNSWGHIWENELPMYRENADGTKHYYEYTIQEITQEDGVEALYHTYNKMDTANIWVPFEGTELVEGDSYIVVSPDVTHVLHPDATTDQRNVTAANSHYVSENTVPLKIGEKTYDTYLLEEQIPQDCIFKGEDYEDLAIALRRATWTNYPLAVDGTTLKVAWWPIRNLYIGDVKVTPHKDGNASENFQVVYINNTFKAGARDSDGENNAQLFTKVRTEAVNQKIFTVTNWKEDEKAIRYRINLQKVSAEDNEVLLPGAEFSLYQADERGKADLSKQVVVTKKTSGTYEYSSVKESNSVETGETVTMETARGGKLVITELPEGDYVLVETKAPTGYLVAEAVTISLSKDSTSSKAYELTIEDEVEREDEGYILPETGGTGTNAYTVGGILLLMISVLLYMRRKNQMKGGREFTGN